MDYWSYKWSDLLLVNSERLRPPAMWSYYHWIRNNVAANTPWDRMVGQLVTARGSTLENGAANFYALHEDSPSLAETISQAFLGMSINCARCHNHPMEKWTNDEYFGFANLFARVRAKTGGGDGEKIIFVASQGNIRPVDFPAAICALYDLQEPFQPAKQLWRRSDLFAEELAEAPAAEA